MMVLLISRNLLADPDNPKSGIVIFGTVMAMSFVGKALAIVVTPLAHRRMSSHDWIIVCLGMGAFSQILWMFSYRLPVMLIAFGVLGLRNPRSQDCSGYNRATRHRRYVPWPGFFLI